MMRKKRDNNEGGRCLAIPTQRKKTKSTNYALETENKATSFISFETLTL